MNRSVPRNPQEIAERGENIYNKKFRQKYEKKHWGLFVVIEVVSEEAYLGDTPEKAVEEARHEAPNGVFHLIKVGTPDAFRVSYNPAAVAQKPKTL